MTKIIADLAVVGRASRERPVDIEATMRAVTSIAGRAVPIDTSLAVMSSLFSLRVARIATGLVATLLVFARVLYALIPELDSDLLFDLLWGYFESLPRTAAALAIVYLVAASVAASMFRRAVAGAGATNARARARALVDAVERGSLEMAITGVSALVIIELATAFLFGGWLLDFQLPDTADWTPVDSALCSLVVVIPIIAAGVTALVFVRRPVRLPAWLAFVVVPLIIGALWLVERAPPSVPLLVLFGGAMILLVVAVVVLVRYRRDLEASILDSVMKP